MPGRRVFDLIEIPDEFWQHPGVLDALRRRDIGRLFVLLNEATGISQTRLAIACDTTPWGTRERRSASPVPWI
jgi:hypothetical protein